MSHNPEGKPQSSHHERTFEKVEFSVITGAIDFLNREFTDILTQKSLVISISDPVLQQTESARLDVRLQQSYENQASLITSYSSYFNAIGFTLVPETDSISIRLDNAKLFVEYVNYRAAQRAMLPSTEQDAKEIQDIKNLIDRAILHVESTMMESSDDATLELLAHGQQIVDAYKKISKNDSWTRLDQLGTYAHYASLGCVREFVRAEKLGLLKPIDMNGYLLRWHTDATAKVLKERWDAVLETLHMIYSNESARAELYETALKNARIALNIALHDLERISSGDALYKPEYAQPLLPVMQSIKVQLNEF